MEWLEDLGVWLSSYGAIIGDWIAIIGGLTIGGISIWQIIGLIRRFVANKKAKKYNEEKEKLIAKEEEVLNKIDSIVETAFKKHLFILVDAFNGVKEKETETKEKIFEEIFNEKQEIEKVEVEIKKESEPINDTEIIETEKVDEIITEEVKTENKAQTTALNNISMGD